MQLPCTPLQLDDDADLGSCIRDQNTPNQLATMKVEKLSWIESDRGCKMYDEKLSDPCCTRSNGVDEWRQGSFIGGCKAGATAFLHICHKSPANCSLQWFREVAPHHLLLCIEPAPLSVFLAAAKPFPLPLPRHRRVPWLMF